MSQSDTVSDFPFKNSFPNPLLFLPTFKFVLEQSRGRMMDGSSGKEATVAQLPISKGIAGVKLGTLAHITLMSALEKDVASALIAEMWCYGGSGPVVRG
jgi:hypothetical protein